MKLVKRAGSLAMVAMATIGMTVVPAATANAAPFPVCPMVVAACTWTEASYEGEMRLFFQEEPMLAPPVRSVSNQDYQAWCFYEQPFYGSGGQSRQVNPGEAVRDLGFDAHSAQQGSCQEN
ncbi:hypothetical protein ACIOGT_36160 [Streptomyces microflavus]|uniref:hypothetical protein n=1 Tax=Streptomyces microflavus TaxID=1919 RepID=UPI00382AD99E